MKFACNRVGVVACSNDINFDIPTTKDEYDEVNFTKTGKKKGWKYNTSGILVHSVNLKWDDSFFLYFHYLDYQKVTKGKNSGII